VGPNKQRSITANQLSCTRQPLLRPLCALSLSFHALSTLDNVKSAVQPFCQSAVLHQREHHPSHCWHHHHRHRHHHRMPTPVPLSLSISMSTASSAVSGLPPLKRHASCTMRLAPCIAPCPSQFLSPCQGPCQPPCQPGCLQTLQQPVNRQVYQVLLLR